MLKKCVQSLAAIVGLVGSLSFCAPLTYSPRPYQYGPVRSEVKEEALRNLGSLLQQLCKHSLTTNDGFICDYELPRHELSAGRDVIAGNYGIRTELKYHEINDLHVSDDRMGTHCIVFNNNPFSYVNNSRRDNPICSQSEIPINEAASAIETLRR